MEPVIVIVGPTASGKTKLAIELAKLMNGEIISADSMQIYKLMDIGTAKPDEAEMSGIRHYLVDEVSPDEEFSVARFRELALGYISLIKNNGKFPIIAGGTGLYINSLIYNISFTEIVSDPGLRESLKKDAEEKGSRFLYQILLHIDPEAAAKIHENDVKRVIRAIEVYTHTQKPISYHQQISRVEPPPYRYIVFGLNWDRAALYQRIEKRVDLMLEKGLLDEVKRLSKQGLNRKNTAMQGLGYKEVFWYLRGEATFEEMASIIKKDTRHYAKRQMTWFKRIEGIEWLDIDENTDIAVLAKNIKNRIATFGIIL